MFGELKFLFSFSDKGVLVGEDNHSFGKGELADQSIVSDVLAEPRRLQRMLVDAGREILDLSMINPDLAPPRYLLDKLSEAVGKPQNHRYAVSRGIRKLRAAFSVKYDTTFGVSLDPEKEVCVCLGSKDALRHTLQAILAPGDRVLLSYPTYPAHLSAVQLAHGKPCFFNIEASEELMLSQIRNSIREHSPRCIVLNFPHNPTGRIISKSFLESVAQLAEAAGAVLVNDFVYGEMVFDRASAATSILAAAPNRKNVVEVYSLSKAYNVPGWRVGALVGCESLVRAVARIKGHVDYGLFLPLQYAAAAALTAPDDLVGSTVREYERRSKILVSGLTRAGYNVITPQAGCCVWAEAPKAAFDIAVAAVPQAAAHASVALSVYLLQHHGILMSPGVVFGAPFDSCMRFALVVGEDRIREVSRRIGLVERGGQGSDQVRIVSGG